MLLLISLLLISALTTAVSWAVVYLYLGQTGNNIVSGNNKFFESSNYPFRPLLTCFGIAGIHFVIATMLKATSDLSFINLMLTAPGFMFTLYFDKLVEYSSFGFPLIIISSIYYGVMVGLLVSKKMYLMMAGVVLICLLILSACFWSMAAAMYN
jgi:hypothetical protein